MNNQEAAYKTNLSFIKQVFIVQLQPWRGSSALAVLLSDTGRFPAASLSCCSCSVAAAVLQLNSRVPKPGAAQARGEERVRAVRLSCHGSKALHGFGVWGCCCAGHLCIAN